VDERDVELLEMYLDGELSARDQAALEQRMRANDEIDEELQRLRDERQLRKAVFASLEADAATTERLMQRVQAGMGQRKEWLRAWRRVGFASAAAAVVALAFIGGWIGGTQKGSSVHAQGPEYHVQIMDEAGRVMAVQKFESLEQAKEFSEDLQQWQARQERLLSGQVTIRSADF